MANLKFMTTWPEVMGGGETLFPEKVMASRLNDQVSTEWILYEKQRQGPPVELMSLVPKIHTINKGNRWKAGDLIHPEVWLDQPHKSKVIQFHRAFKCTGTQDISVKYLATGVTYIAKKGTEPKIGYAPRNTFVKKVTVDGKALRLKKLKELAIFDGFNDLSHFFKYFHEDFEGQIIHWSKNRY